MLIKAIAADLPLSLYMTFVLHLGSVWFTGLNHKEMMRPCRETSVGCNPMFTGSYCHSCGAARALGRGHLPCAPAQMHHHPRVHAAYVTGSQS